MRVSKEQNEQFWTALRSKQAWRKLIVTIKMELKYQDWLKRNDIDEMDWTRETFIQFTVDAL